MPRVAVVTGGGVGARAVDLPAPRARTAGGWRCSTWTAPPQRRSAASAARRRGRTPSPARSTSSDRAAVDRPSTHVRAALGPIEILVDERGRVGVRAVRGPSPLDDWSRTIAVNLTGTFNCLQSAIPDMVAAGWGRIVTISSAAGQTGSPRQAHYSASKGGVIALTKTVALEYAAKGITANTIPPFTVDTPMLRGRAGVEAAAGRRGAGQDGPGRSARHRRRHRRRVRVPVLRRRRATSPARSSRVNGGAVT